MISIEKKHLTIFLYILGIGLLISVIFFMMPALFQHSDTYMKKARFHIQFIQNALEKYHNDYGRYPNSDEGLKLLIEQKNAKGEPYLPRMINDPWSRPYHYRSPGVFNKDKFDLWTYGADNAPGGKGSNTDITNWDKKS